MMTMGRLIRRVFWGEGDKWQPWLAIFWLLTAIAIWTYIIGYKLPHNPDQTESPNTKRDATVTTVEPDRSLD